jgi:hypothetical protein
MRWCCPIVIGLAIVLAGCGGGDESNQSPTSTTSSAAATTTSEEEFVQPTLTPAAIKRCLLEGGSELRIAPPLAPKGSPLRTPAIYAIGPANGHIGAILTPNMRIARQIKAILDRQAQWFGLPVRQGRALMLIDSATEARDKRLIEKCVQGVA